MLRPYEESTSGSDNFDGGSSNGGLVATGSDKAGAMTIVRQFGFRAASAVSTLELRIYDDTGTPVLMATPVSESTVTTYIESGLDLALPPGWTAQVFTTGASAGGTAWAIVEEASGY
jgi:hypothetical protein